MNFRLQLFELRVKRDDNTKDETGIHHRFSEDVVKAWFHTDSFQPSSSHADWHTHC